jgi:inosine/xanthosine triphosphatase
MAKRAHDSPNRGVVRNLCRNHRFKPGSADADPMRVCLGGTFDVLHVGHERLLAKAFELSDEVFIGVTSQEMAQRSRNRRVRPLKQRIQNLERLLARSGWKGTVAVIEHPFGRATQPEYDAIVVSPETRHRVKPINAARRRRRLKPLKAIEVDYAYADDGLPVSATRIRQGDIDGRGRRLRPLRVAVGTANALKKKAVAAAFARAFPKLKTTVRAFDVASGVPEQPRDAQTATGALLRAEAALAVWTKADYGVGVEAGLLMDKSLGRHLDVQYCAVTDRTGGVSVGHGGGFYYPDGVTSAALDGKTVSQVLGPMAGDRRIGSTTGAIGFLTRGAIDRSELTTHGVLMALVPRIRPELYQSLP